MSIPLRFRDYLEATIAATYDDYVQRPSMRTRNAEEFARMQQYLLDYYADKSVVKSVFVGRQIFDCVVVQASLTSADREDDSSCPQGSIPVRRITLEELTRFRTLREFLGKAPE